MNKDKSEEDFLKYAHKNPTSFYLSAEQSVMDGFKYFKTESYRSKPGAILSRPKTLIKSKSFIELIKLGCEISKVMPSILKNINKSYSDMETFISYVEHKEKISEPSKAVLETIPNQDIWEEVKSYVWEKYKVIVGFTALPQEFIFSDKAVPFAYAFVFAQEMNKEAIEKAPKIDTGIEVINVYNSLGIIVNDVADWLREKYGILCMANHPLGGLVDTVPLAAKAGLGYIGRNGLLITKEFGPRCRLAPIFVEEAIVEFTDSTEHKWIGEFCKKCGNCKRLCPKSAIYDAPKLAIAFNKNNVQDRYECYDREKCFASFAETMGCAVCMSVCPFSKNPGSYDKMKRTISK